MNTLRELRRTFAHRLFVNTLYSLPLVTWLVGWEMGMWLRIVFHVSPHYDGGLS